MRLWGAVFLALVGCDGGKRAPLPCAYDCLGGACADGLCQPVPVVSGIDDNAYYLAVDDSRVYWVALTGAVGSVRKDGSDRRAIGSVDCSSVLAVAVDATTVYVGCSFGRGGLYALAKDGTSTTKLDPRDTTSLAVDPGGRLVASVGGAIKWFDNDGGVVSNDTAFVLAVDGTGTYWSTFFSLGWSIGWGYDSCNDDPAGRVAVASDAQVREIATGRVPPFGLTTNGTTMFWTDKCERTLNAVAHGGSNVVLASNLGSAPPAPMNGGWGSTPPRAWTGPLAADSKHVYVVASSPHSAGLRTLMRVAVSGGAPTVIADLPEGGNLAIDETSLYTVEQRAGGKSQILRIAKPP